MHCNRFIGETYARSGFQIALFPCSPKIFFRRHRAGGGGLGTRLAFRRVCCFCSCCYVPRTSS